MSRSLVGSFKNLLMAVLIGLLLISLAIWGVSDAFTPNSKDAAAMVGSEKVKLTEFDRRFRQRLRDENQQRPERITTKQAFGLGLHRDVIAQLINVKLLKLDADDLGIDVNSRDALAYVEGIGAFNNEITGKYDKQKLREVLSRQSNGPSVKEFEAQVYSDIRLDQTLSGLMSGVSAPSEYGEQQFKFLTEQRKVKLLTLDRNAVEKPADPSDEDLKTYIDANASRYIAPEYRRFTMVRLEVSDVLPDMVATEEEVADLFDYKIKAGQLGSVETRSLSQYVSEDQASADLLTAAFNAGGDTAPVLAENGIEAPLTYTNILASQTTDPVTGEAAFEMNVNEAKTVKGSLGTWYTVVVTDINAASIPVLENERASIEEEIKKNNAERIIYDTLDTLQVSLDEGASLEEAANASEIGIASYDFVSRVGNTQSGDRMEGFERAPGVAGDDTILTEIFTSEPGFEGDVIESDTKGIFAIRVDEVENSAPRAFATIKEEALDNWHLEKADEALGELSDALAIRIDDGESLEAIADSINSGAAVTEVTMMRAAGAEGISDQLAARLFDGRADQTIRGLATNGLNRVIGQITEIIANEDELSGAMADNFAEQVDKVINQDIEQAYRQALMTEYPSRAIEDNMARVLGVSDQ